MRVAELTDSYTLVKNFSVFPLPTVGPHTLDGLSPERGRRKEDRLFPIM